MPNDRVFLGWNHPCLELATQWLHENFSRPPSEPGRPDPVISQIKNTPTTWDLSHLLIVLPGSRAARRLLELLVLHAEKNPNTLLLPPRIITTGELPESLYSPSNSLISPLHANILRAQCLASVNQTHPQLLLALLPDPPQQNDFTGWLALAQELETLNATLAADAMPIDQVAPRAADILDFSFHDEARWQALTALQQHYESRLEELNFIDRHAARFAALKNHTCTSEQHIILLATADLNLISRNMLLTMRDAAITALIHAPQSEEKNFDALGCLDVEAWSQRPVSIDDEAMHFVNRPADEAYETIHQLNKPLKNKDESLAQLFTRQQITIGLGDENAAPMMQRSLELSGVPTRSGIGQKAHRSRPALLLDALAKLIDQNRMIDLSDLLRHPDFETHLLAAIPKSPSAEPAKTREAIGNWISLTDDYITQHLRGQSLDHWLGDEAQIAPLKQVHDHILSLLPPPKESEKPATLAHWAIIISQILTTIYASHHLQENHPQHKSLAESLGLIGDALRQFTTIPAEQSPQIKLSQAMRVLLAHLATAALSPPPQPQSLELLGWLELQLDDAPALIITGFNESLIPQSKTSDPFLPDALRKCLGLTDNHRRLARDAYALTAILHSRRHVQLIAARRGSDNEPLTPSRLLLNGAPQKLAARVLHFFAEPQHPATIDTLLPWREKNEILMPLPAAQIPEITSMRVTDFARYLACPYRFYLSNILKLEGSDDSAVELDPMQFGTLTHQILEDFARSELASATDPDDIEAFFSAKTTDLIRLQFGKKPPAAVVIQSAQLQFRLANFARWQAAQTAAGWKILPPLTERNVQAPFIVDDKPITLVGRIDRIDLHPQMGYRLMDYKTGDTAKTPDMVHRQWAEHGKMWVDLQLPLYRELAKSITLIDASKPLSLGYMLLPKDSKNVTFEQATWEDFEWDEAIGIARMVVRNIRKKIFWPPAQPPEYPDDFAFLCGDELSERAQIIQLSARTRRAP